MITNIQSLMDKSKNFAKDNNLSVQQVLQNYMFERFLARLSKSKYKDKFIIKGGLLLSSIMGINMRTTMDIDANITGMRFDLSQISKIIEDVVSIEIDDNVIFNVEKTTPIKEENEYGGYKFKITGITGNIKVPFSIDVSTGDVITPKAIEYKYKMILEDEYIDLYTYNYETIVAEKLETILKRNVANSRMKDYYDIYYFVNVKWNEIDKGILEDAIRTTFRHRDSDDELENYMQIVDLIEKNENLKSLWKAYQSRHSYAENIEFQEAVNAIIFIYNEIIKKVAVTID